MGAAVRFTTNGGVNFKNNKKGHHEFKTYTVVKQNNLNLKIFCNDDAWVSPIKVHNIVW